MLFLLLPRIHSLSDDDFVVTKDLVKSINENPKSTFKAVYYPKFASMRLRDFKRFLSPVRKAPEVHASARPVGFSERSFHNSDKRMFTGIYKEVICSHSRDGEYNDWHEFSDEVESIQDGEESIFEKNGKVYPKHQFDCTKNDNVQIQYKVQYPGENVPFPVFDNTQLCSSWASAVTSAMSTTLSRWSNENVNLSIQFLLDCDILGDPCMERPPLSAYEQFWRRYIPLSDRWRNPENPLETPHHQLTKEICDNYKSCYPGEQNCKRHAVLTGLCEPGNQLSGTCPIYFLYNWRWIKSHLAEVGAVTSSILVRPDFFTYRNGTYKSDMSQEILGMLDVTIIGWGQSMINLIQTSTTIEEKQRWWYVIPHLGIDFGLTCKELLSPIEQKNNENVVDIEDTFTSTSNSITIKKTESRSI